MKTLKLYLILLGSLLVLLGSSAYVLKRQVNSSPVFAQVKDYDNSKLIKFDHKLHVVDLSVKCEDCHTAAVKSVSAKDNLNPKEATCGTCHDVKDEKNCNFCHINNKYKKLKHKESELIFSHNYHIETEKKQCTDCHTGLDKVKYSKESAGAFPSMETCNSCHSNQKATNTSQNCEGCHTNLTSLTPVSHKRNNFLNEHKLQFGSSASNNCMMCHSDNFCQVCHSPVKYSGENKNENFYVPYYTKEGATRIDRDALQKLTTVHNLNYKFTHGLDANQKRFECKTCHEPVTFCASCHQNGGDLMTGILPQSHQQAGFVTLGVNTGGGLHSKLAKKDIESCQSCHDVQGADPACIKCHFDNDGVKGTNPKTHEPGFLSDEKGLWHDTQGAVCYTCHTDPNARPDGVKGRGFCRYCHPTVEPFQR